MHAYHHSGNPIKTKMIIEQLTDEMINDLKTIQAVCRSCNVNVLSMTLEPCDNQLRIKDAVFIGNEYSKTGCKNHSPE